MIFVDLNQVFVSNIMMHLNSKVKTSDIDENLVRHIILNSLRSYVRQFSQTYGKNVIICCDNRKYWRKEAFPYYKANRRKDRDASQINWSAIFEIAGKIKEEMKQSLPYKVLDVDGAEADDIIAVLVKKFAAQEPILILSSDKDYMQLQKHGKNIKQYSPILKRFIHTDDPELYIREHIIRGDRGDGVPNFLSADSTFVSGERQKTINNQKLTEWLKAPTPESFCTTDEMKRGYSRNQILVDMDYIPANICEAIVTAYLETKPATRSKLLTYLMAYKMKNLIPVADEF